MASNLVSRCQNSSLCLHLGAPLPPWPVACDPSPIHAGAGGARSRATANGCRPTYAAILRRISEVIVEPRLQRKATVEILPQTAVVRLTRRVPHRCPIQFPRKPL